MSEEQSQRAPDRAVEAGRGAIFIGAAKAFFMVSASVQKFLLPRVIGAADFGVFSVVNAAVSVLNNATTQGTTQAVSKFTAEDDRQADAVKAAGLRLGLVFGAVLGLGFFALAPAIARFFNHPEFTRWFRIVALIPFFYSLYSVFVGSANGLRRFRVQAGFDISFSTLKTILLLVGAAVFGLVGAFGGFVTAAVVIMVVSALVMKMPRIGSGTFPMARLVRFMIGIVIYTLLINVALNYDLLLLRRFATSAATAEAANQLAGYYEAVRNFSLLPYQALLVVTFVIFPLVSKSTFEQDRETTRAYVTQTLRYALILAASMAAVLAARPRGLLLTVYGKVEYAAGEHALPILVAGIVCLALLGVAGSIINASGHPAIAGSFVGATVLVGGGAAYALVPGQTPGPDMLRAAALATALGMAAGFGGALVYLRRRFSAGPPLATVVRVAVAAAMAIAAGRFVPGEGKIVSLAAVALAGVIFLGALIVLREFGPQDRAKFRKILSRRS